MVKFALFAVALVHVLCVPAWATIPNGEGGAASFYLDPNTCAKGYYCYEIQKPAPEPESKKDEEKPAVVDVPIFTGKVDWDSVWTMPPEQMRELINQAMSFAQENPSDEERMLTYLKLQGIAMRRAKKFQEAWADLLVKYPALDTTVERAPTLAATTAEVVAEREDRADAIQAMRENMGILYFYSSSCRYCQQQSEILQSFIEKWGWKNITAVDVSAAPHLVEQYGVQAVPDIWVVGRVDGETLQRRIRSGLTEHADLERGLLKAWTLWTKETRYERPTMTHQLETFEDFLKARKVYR